MQKVLDLQKLEAVNPTLATENSSCTSSLIHCCCGCGDDVVIE